MPPKEDCPICFLRLPYRESGSTYMPCCGKELCTGCIYAFQSRITKDEHNLGPFCRAPTPKSEEEITKRLKKRVELNDAQAMYNVACHYCNGRFGLPRDHAKALELWHRAAELGDADAYCNVANAYKDGRGVERDEKKALHYAELAAIEGESKARYNLGVSELHAFNFDRALRHFMIAARDGYSNSLEGIKIMYLGGDATKDDHTKALRSYQSYLNEIKSDQRDEAVAFDDKSPTKNTMNLPSNLIIR